MKIYENEEEQRKKKRDPKKIKAFTLNDRLFLSVYFIITDIEP